jgi:hypothetical protein
MEVKPAEFARMCSVSKVAISSKIKNGTLILNSGKKLDTDNPVNRAYLDKHQAKVKARLESERIERAVAGVKDYVDNNDSKQEVEQVTTRNNSGKRTRAGELLDMTIRQLVRTYSTMDNVEKYSKILRDLTAADEREQKTQERRLVQIPKDFVVQRLFGYTDTLMNQLLDVPESICDQIIAIVKSKGDGCRNDIIHVISDNLTKCISGAKEHALGELASLRNKYDKKDSAIEHATNALKEMIDD